MCICICTHKQIQMGMLPAPVLPAKKKEKSMIYGRQCVVPQSHQILKAKRSCCLDGRLPKNLEMMAMANRLGFSLALKAPFGVTRSLLQLDGTSVCRVVYL